MPGDEHGKGAHEHGKEHKGEHGHGPGHKDGHGPEGKHGGRRHHDRDPDDSDDDSESDDEHCPKHGGDEKHKGMRGAGRKAAKEYRRTHNLKRGDMTEEQLKEMKNVRREARKACKG